MKLVILIIVVIIILLVILAASHSVPKPDKKHSAFAKAVKKPDCPSYITPMSFKPGYLKDPPQKLANMCSDVMYPVNPVYVNYGLYNNPCDSDTVKFNSIP